MIWLVSSLKYSYLKEHTPVCKVRPTVSHSRLALDAHTKINFVVSGNVDFSCAVASQELASISFVKSEPDVLKDPHSISALYI